jgi:nucleoside-diphosphate-sugar epimerase
MKVDSVAVFGGAGKIGRRVVQALRERGVTVRALVHRTSLGQQDGIEVVRGSIGEAAMVRKVVRGTDAVIQLATTKEDAGTFFDVSVRGTLNVLEACRFEGTRQFLLFGGDAAFGIWFYPQPLPIDENHPLMAYPGYYAFTKVMEEVMTQQYSIQYGVPYTILRSSWVFERDDLLRHFSLLENVDPAEPGHGFGKVSDEIMALVRAKQERIPVLTDLQGVPYHRHIVYIDDLMQGFAKALANPAALGHSFNIAGPAPFSYRVAADYIAAQMHLPTVTIACPGYHSFAINITKARSLLGYAPQLDIVAMADAALAWRQRQQKRG